MPFFELAGGWLSSLARDCEAEGTTLLDEIDRAISSINEELAPRVHDQWLVIKKPRVPILTRMRWLRGEVASRPHDLEGIERDDRERERMRLASEAVILARYCREGLKALAAAGIADQPVPGSLGMGEAIQALPRRVNLGEWARQATTTARQTKVKKGRRR